MIGARADETATGASERTSDDDPPVAPNRRSGAASPPPSAAPGPDVTGSGVGVEIDVRPGPTDGCVIVRLTGDFDRSCIVAFDDACTELVGSVDEITVDVSATDVIDSAALGALIRLRRDLEEHGGRLRTVVGRPFQARVMAITGLVDHLQVVDRSPG